MRTATLAVASLFLALAGCKQPDEQKSAPPPTAKPVTAAPAPVVAGFVHQPRFDAFGYHSPDREVRIGDQRLSVLAVGGGEEFDAWETGDRKAAYAPVMLVFDQVNGPSQTNELGATEAVNSIRVMPDAYAVGDTEIRFEGQDPKLGRIAFQGALDRKALAGAQADASGSAVVLVGDLQVGDQRFERLNFTWFGGD